MEAQGLTRRAFMGAVGLAAFGAALGMAGCSKQVSEQGVLYAPNGSDAMKVVGYEGSPDKIDVPDSIGGLAVTAIDVRAFENCTTLATLRPGGTRLIEHGAFAGCTGLSDVSFTASLQKIGASAFEGCTALPSVQAESSLGSIGTRSFAGCTALTVVDVAGCYGIGENAFAGCTALETVDIANNLHAIGQGAFEGCTALTHFASTSESATVKIAPRAFADCKGLTDVEFRGKVAIERDAFVGCTSLTSIVVGADSTIEEGALPAGCEAAEYVDESKGEVVHTETRGATTGWTSNVTQQAAAVSESASWNESADDASSDDQGHTDAQGQSPTAESLDPWKS